MLLELNNIHPQVNFPCKPMVNNQMLFLDYLVIKEGNNSEEKVYKNQRYPKSFIEKEIRKTLEKMKNTPNNWNKDKTDVIAKLFLPYKRDMERKSNTLLKNMALK